MSKSVNKVILMGYVGKEPKVETLKSKDKKTTLRLATTYVVTPKDGEPKQFTEWHNVVAWNSLADLVEQFKTKKGSRLYVEGRLKTESWADKKTGEQKSRTDIVASDIAFLGNKAEADASTHVEDNDAAVGQNTPDTPAHVADNNDAVVQNKDTTPDMACEW